MARKFQMQGHSVATGSLVAWLADSQDWSASQAEEPVTDATVYARGPTAITSIPIINTILEPSNGSAMVGVALLITGRTTRSASSVAVSFAGVTGSAMLSGLTWSFLATPTLSGSQTIAATATDASNGTTSTASATLTVAAATTLPAGITPLAWFDGPRASTFADTAGTVPATARGALVRRLNDSATGSWQSPAGSPSYRDLTGLRIEPSDINDGAHPFPLSNDTAGMTALAMNNCTFAVSWVQRWGTGTMGLAATPNWGVYGGLGFYANSNTQYDLSAFGFVPVIGAHHSLIVTWTPTAVISKFMTNGFVTATNTTTMSVAAGSPSNPQLIIGAFQEYFYGSVTELIVVNGSTTTTQRDNLLAFVDSVPWVPAFALDQPLVATTGDSNVVGVAVNNYDTWKFRMLRSLRPTYNVEQICTAIVGTGVNGHAGYIAPYYDSRRAKHIAIFEAGTNDIASGATAATVLPVVFAQLDAMRAQGWKTIVLTLPDRRGLLGSTSQAFMDTERAAYRAGILASGTLHSDVVIDLGAVTHLGANGDANNTTYFHTDAVHLIAGGQALVEPLVSAAAASLLAA